MEGKTKFRALQLIKYKEPLLVTELDLPKPGKNQVLVKIEYVVINPSDVSLLRGGYQVPFQPPFTPGFEGSGTVVELGTDLETNHKVGDRVSVADTQIWGEYALVSANVAFPMLPDTTFEEAASHWVNPASVYAMIEEEVKNGGHKALIHTAGSSALGKMLIRFAKEKGIKTINLVRREEAVKELLDLGADYVLNTTNADFEDQLKKISHEISATIAFDALAGDTTTKVLKVMPVESHVLVYGALESGVLNGITVGNCIFEGKVLRGFWLTKLAKKWNAAKLQEVGSIIQKSIKTTFKSDVAKVFKFEEVDQALEYYAKNASKGKVLLKFSA